MRVLIDTCVFLWLEQQDVEKFPLGALGLLEDPETELVLSHASVWEVAIKRSIGKLPATVPLKDALEKHLKAGRFHLLPIALPHVLAVEGLPFHHRDPFDRLILAQALTEQLPLMSADAVFTQYGVQRVWE